MISRSRRADHYGGQQIVSASRCPPPIHDERAACPHACLAALFLKENVWGRPRMGWNAKYRGMLMLLAALLITQSAWAQKNSGPLLPIDAPPSFPAARPQMPPPQMSPQMSPQPMMPRVSPQASVSGAGNPDAERMARTLPLDPQTRDLQDQLPANPRDVERRLGLREPRGPATDMRGRTPTPREMVNALTPR